MFKILLTGCPFATAALCSVLLFPALAPAQQASPRTTYNTAEMTEEARADERELRRVAAEALARILGSPRYSDELSLRFLGQEKLAEGDALEPEDGEEAFGYGRLRGEAVTRIHAFNPTSRNAFELAMPRSLIRLIGATVRRRGGHEGEPGPLGGPPIDDPAREPEDGDREPGYDREGALPTPRRDAAAPSLPLHLASWSNNSDDRFRYSSTVSAMTSWPYRAIAHFDNNCSGAFFGPRHVLTAGHCIYSRRNNSWNAINAITPGRAGGNFNFDQVGIPQAGFNWYFTPAPWRIIASPGHFQYDIGILIVAERLGARTGGMGWFIGTDGFLRDSFLRNRGYPWCNARTSSGTPRADDPGDPGSNVVCLPSHLYGDPFDCDIGNFGSEDEEGWTRRFSHSCDASAGQSGSPIYVVRDGIVYIVGVHTRSRCGQTAASTACTEDDDTPLVATRITPEYADWMSYFRAWRP